jgi:tetratricopeptide (TPR) repeat protein
LTELDEKKRQGRRLHGEYLTSLGLLREDQLSLGLLEQLRRKLMYVSSLPPETKYAFYVAFDGLANWGNSQPLGIDSVSLIWNMLHTATPEEQVAASLTRIGKSRLRIAPGADPARLLLAESEASVVNKIVSEPCTVEALVQAADLEPREVHLLVYLLFITRQVEIVTSSDRTMSIRPLVGNSGQLGASGSSPPRATAPSRSLPKFGSMPPSTSKGAAANQPPETLSEELAGRWREINDRASTIDHADYFEMLGVSRNASRKDIESAFYALARRWHPDRLPTELAPIRDACSRVFSRMSEALATLMDDEQRAQYVQLVSEGGGSPAVQETVARVLEAAMNFQKAEVCFKRNDLVQAEELCKRAMESDATQADYRAMLAWLIALKPEFQSPDKTAECIRMLDEAIFISDRCEKAFYWRGQLHKRIGKNDIALKDFKRAMELNAHNIDAAREVRLYQMRAGRSGVVSNPAGQRGSSPHHGDPPPKLGFFSRLFKKQK